MDVKFVREKTGLTQAELAEEIGVSQPLVAQWEAGRREPSNGQLMDMARLLPDIMPRGRWPDRGRTDTYPAAPAGGMPGAKEAMERRVFMARRNAKLQGNDPDAAEGRVLEDLKAAADRHKTSAKERR